MKVKEIKTNRVIEVNDSYAARMIEQGRAVPVPAKKEPAQKVPRATKAPGA